MKKYNNFKIIFNNIIEFIEFCCFSNSYFICRFYLTKSMAQMPALIPKEVEIQRLKKIWLMVIALGSIAASVEVDNFVDGSLHQTFY